MTTETISLFLSVVSIAGVITAWIFQYGKLHSDVKSLQENFIEYKRKTDKTVEDVAELKGSFNTYRFIKSDSPIKLTEGGIDLLQNSGGKAYLDKNIEDLYEKFEGIDNEYDIQKKARDIMRDKEHDKNFDAMKKYLYQKGLSFDDLSTVMGVYLRDKVFEKKNMQPVQKEQVVRDE